MVKSPRLKRDRGRPALQPLQSGDIFERALRPSPGSRRPEETKMTLDRRQFLQLSALGILATVAASACAAPGDRADAAVDRPQLLAMLGPERVRELGAHYRASTPSENSVDALRAALSTGRGPQNPTIKNGSLDGQIRDDFAAGRTVMIDGWVLSVTEARQAALFSLTPA